jgi:hypothetical protein
MTMTDPMKMILKNLKLETNLFPPTSRYYGIETAQTEIKDGKTVVYLKRRFIPQPERYDLIREYTVTEGDRPDNLAAQQLGDPEQSWRIADPNNVMRPEELTEEVGRKLRITLPEGIPGAQNA